MKQTLTTEAMQEIYEAVVHSEASGSQEAEFELLCKLEDVGGTSATIRKLIDLVRAANREAQPVGYAENGKGFIYQPEHRDRIKNPVAVYTAPPAPALIILDKVSCEGFDPKDWVEARNLGQCEGWNAYRAELLSQPVSQGYKLNSPEIPDGCQWTFDEHDSKWDSGCGEAWMFCDGGPTENGVKFCQSCGKPVLLSAAPEGGNGA